MICTRSQQKQEQPSKVAAYLIFLNFKMSSLRSQQRNTKKQVSELLKEWDVSDEYHMNVDQVQEVDYSTTKKFFIEQIHYN
jgi:hypothetical protein